MSPLLLAAVVVISLVPVEAAIPEPGGRLRKEGMPSSTKMSPIWTWWPVDLLKQLNGTSRQSVPQLRWWRKQTLGLGRSSQRQWRRTLFQTRRGPGKSSAPQEDGAVCYNTIYNVGGELLTSTGDVVQKWKKYFEDLLSPAVLSVEEAELKDYTGKLAYYPG